MKMHYHKKKNTNIKWSCDSVILLSGHYYRRYMLKDITKNTQNKVKQLKQVGDISQFFGYN